VDTFVAPGQLGDTLREEPRWVGALLVGAAISLITAALIPVEAFEVALAAGDAAGGGLGGGDTPISEEALLRIMRWGAVIGAPLMTLVMTLVVGGLSALLFVGILGDEGRFKQHLAMAAHSNLIVAVGGIASLILIIIAGDFRAAVTLGTFFQPLLEDGYPLRVLSQLSPVGIWALIVMGIGVSRFDRERGWVSPIIWLMTFRILLALAFGLIRVPGGFG